MTWQLWIVLGFQVLVLILQPVNVGKERKPRTEGEAVIGIGLSLLMIGLIFWGTA